MRGSKKLCIEHEGGVAISHASIIVEPLRLELERAREPLAALSSPGTIQLRRPSVAP